jgi:hypothetical protein
MNKQDKKEIMNLIKYKKMLGGRRMKLEEAIERVKDLKEDCETSVYYNVQLSDDRSEAVALEVVLNELGRLTQENKELKQALDERYNKGYQDGFKQAKFDCEMDKLDGR